MQIKKTRLLTPGPTPIYPKALHAMLGADMHHRTQDFRNVFLAVLADLKLVMGTAHDVLVLVASGTGAMEASGDQLFFPGRSRDRLHGGKIRRALGRNDAGVRARCDRSRSSVWKSGERGGARERAVIPM